MVNSRVLKLLKKEFNKMEANMRIYWQWNFTETVPSHCTQIICISSFQEFKWYISIFLKGAYILITTWKCCDSENGKECYQKQRCTRELLLLLFVFLGLVVGGLLFLKVFFLLPSSLINSSVVVFYFWYHCIKESWGRCLRERQETRKRAKAMTAAWIFELIWSCYYFTVAGTRR